MLQAGTLIGKYVVRRKLAEGGMAEIYLCSFRGPEGFEKDVVIKRIRAFLAGDPSFVQMFISEARLASRLNHANLVQIFDFEKHEDTYYLAMEYVRGHSLWDVRKRSKELMEPMPPTLVAHVGVQVARGLGHAHALQDKGKPLQLVHRDVTPHNVLLSFDGAVKLTDFGVAKHSASATSAGVLKGKFAYMSPEQARAEPVDARTDLFALGIVLWEMLTGGRLFDGDSDVAVLRAVQTSAIAPPARLNPAVPEALSELVMKALQRDPAERFQSASQMERALAGFVLAHAKSVDDTDLPAYLRKLYPDEEVSKVTSLPSATVSGLEPTAQQRRPDPEPAPPPPPPSPDEDMHAPTNIAPGAPTVSLRAVVRPPDTVPISIARRGLPTIGMRRAVLGTALIAAVIAIAGAVVATRNAPIEAMRAAGPLKTSTVATASPAVGSTPVSGPADVTPTAHVPERPAAPSEPEPLAETPPAPPPPGVLLVRVRPYASVFIDGKYVRDAQGTATFELAPGDHKVKLQHPRGRKEATVTIESGKETALVRNFTP